jgi:hypothetical protein
MRACFRVLAFSLALAVMATLSTPATLAQSTYARDVGVSQTAGTTCSAGEPVALNGNLHFVYSFTTDPTTGANRYQINIASSLSGVGQATQTNYTGTGSFGYDFPSPDSPAQITVQLKYGLNSQGSAPSLTLTQTVNITVDTGGNVSASVVGSSTQCAGS